MQSFVYVNADNLIVIKEKTRLRKITAFFVLNVTLLVLNIIGKTHEKRKAVLYFVSSGIRSDASFS